MVRNYSLKRGVLLTVMALLILVLVSVNVQGARRHKENAMTWRGKTNGGNEKNYVNLTGRGHRASPRPLRRLRLQVMITWNHITSFQSLAKLICNKVSSLGPIIKFDWLPSNQKTWYRENVKCKNKHTKVTMVLHKFQDGLQRFSASFDKLKSYRNGLGLTLECRVRRQKVLEDISTKLIQLRNELEKTMVDLKMRNEMPGLDEETVASFMPDYGIDMTTTQLYDWGIISSYEIYIGEWKKIIRHVVGPKGNAKCPKRHHNNLNYL